MIDFITGNTGDIVQFVLQLVGAFSILAAWTPNKADNKIASVLLEMVNFLGANLNKAKNSDSA